MVVPHLLVSVRFPPTSREGSGNKSTGRRPENRASFQVSLQYVRRQYAAGYCRTYWLRDESLTGLPGWKGPDISSITEDDFAQNLLEMSGRAVKAQTEMVTQSCVEWRRRFLPRFLHMDLEQRARRIYFRYRSRGTLLRICVASSRFAATVLYEDEPIISPIITPGKSKRCVLKADNHVITVSLLRCRLFLSLKHRFPLLGAFLLIDHHDFAAGYGDESGTDY